MSDSPIATHRRKELLTLGGFCLLVLLTLALAAYPYWISERQVRTALRVKHTHEVLAYAASIRATLGDIRIAQRDHVLSGNDRDLARYDNALKRIKGDVERLRGLTADNPSQQARLDSFDAALQALLSGERSALNAGRTPSAGAPPADIQRRANDRLQAAMTSIERHERELLQARETEERAALQQFHLSVAALAGFMVIVLAFLYSTVRRRQAAEQKWRQREENLRLMADNTVDYGIFMLDPSGRVSTWNPGAERIKGYGAEEIIGRHFSCFYPPEDAAAGKPAMELETAAAAGRVRDEGWRVRKNGERFWADVVITALRDGAGPVRGYAKLTRDMTERKHQEEQLRNEIAERKRIDADLEALNESLAERVAAATVELQTANDSLKQEMIERTLAQASLLQSESRLRSILDSAMDAVITVDETERVVLFNAAAEEIFGWPRNEALGAPLSMFIPERFRTAHSGHMRLFGTAGVSSRRMGGQRVVTGLRRGGEEFPIDASISQVTGAGGRLFTVILRDITERVRAEQALLRSKDELRELAAVAGTAREQEKSRVARELHDELAQSLTALKMDLIWAEERLSPDQKPLRSKLETMGALVDGAVTATRRIAADLRPLMLDDLGLVPAAEWLVQNFTQRTGVHCSMAIDPPELELQDPHATAVFRILQESLTNIARHARASRVDVTIRARNREITLEVRDDGRGFQPGDPRKPNSFGLAGLRERAYLLDGILRLTTAPGRGTVIEVLFPLPGAEANQGAAVSPGGSIATFLDLD